MKRLALISILVALLHGAAFAQYQAVQGSCTTGGVKVVTQGMMSTTTVQGSFPRCSVTVYLTGTTNQATIYSSATGAVKGNPFTANTDASWLFYATAGVGVDIVLQGGTPISLPQPVTLTDVVPGGGGGGGGNPAPPSYSLQFANAPVNAFQGDATLTFNTGTKAVTGKIINSVANTDSFLSGSGNNGIQNCSTAGWATCTTPSTSTSQELPALETYAPSFSVLPGIASGVWAQDLRGGVSNIAVNSYGLNGNNSTPINAYLYSQAQPGAPIANAGAEVTTTLFTLAADPHNTGANSTEKSTQGNNADRMFSMSSGQNVYDSHNMFATGGSGDELGFGNGVMYCSGGGIAVSAQEGCHLGVTSGYDYYSNWTASVGTTAAAGSTTLVTTNSNNAASGPGQERYFDDITQAITPPAGCRIASSNGTDTPLASVTFAGTGCTPAGAVLLLVGKRYAAITGFTTSSSGGTNTAVFTTSYSDLQVGDVINLEGFAGSGLHFNTVYLTVTATSPLTATTRAYPLPATGTDTGIGVASFTESDDVMTGCTTDGTQKTTCTYTTNPKQVTHTNIALVLSGTTAVGSNPKLCNVTVSPPTLLQVGSNQFSFTSPALPIGTVCTGGIASGWSAGTQAAEVITTSLPSGFSTSTSSISNGVCHVADGYAQQLDNPETVNLTVTDSTHVQLINLQRPHENPVVLSCGGYGGYSLIPVADIQGTGNLSALSGGSLYHSLHIDGCNTSNKCYLSNPNYSVTTGETSYAYYSSTITSITTAAGVATVTIPTAVNFNVAGVVISGNSASDLNGTVTATQTSPTTFTFPTTATDSGTGGTALVNRAAYYIAPSSLIEYVENPNNCTGGVCLMDGTFPVLPLPTAFNANDVIALPVSGGVSGEEGFKIIRQSIGGLNYPPGGGLGGRITGYPSSSREGFGIFLLPDVPTFYLKHGGTYPTPVNGIDVGGMFQFAHAMTMGDIGAIHITCNLYFGCSNNPFGNKYSGIQIDNAQNTPLGISYDTQAATATYNAVSHVFSGTVSIPILAGPMTVRGPGTIGNGTFNVLDTEAAATYMSPLNIAIPNMAVGDTALETHGINAANLNQAYFDYFYFAGTSSTANYRGMGMAQQSAQVCLFGSGNTTIGLLSGACTDGGQALNVTGSLGFNGPSGGSDSIILSRASPGVLSVDTTTAGNGLGSIQAHAATINGSAVCTTATGCGAAAVTPCISAASPAVCGASTQGFVAIPLTATTLTVNTTAVGANSRILLQFDGTLSTALGVTCSGVGLQLLPSGRTPGTSFTVTANTTSSNYGCFSYVILN